MKLTEWTSCGGCAAKWPGGQLGALLGSLGPVGDPNLLLGLAPFDDAAVYRLTDDTALVSTTDFFPPLVDDPADFGAIAAANACSDVFAMGGRVILALNISAFPESFPTETVAEILAAASAVVRDAGGSVAGGHTIRSEEPIFGLAVQGLVHPDHIWTKGGARRGDKVLLSKPIGTGIVLAGGDQSAKARTVEEMRRLNRRAADQLRDLEHRSGAQPVHAVTDITGYGLAGHGWEIAERSSATVRLDVDRVPLYEGALELSQRGIRTGGDSRNRAYLGANVSGLVPPELEALMFDPQTSGGLLACVDPDCGSHLESDGWWEIGCVGEGTPSVELRSGGRGT
jgi:selenide,water dikinase